jgi:hypothetical protein
VQDRYVGDIGDFGKYALLSALAGRDLRLGVHWYRNADEEANGDGKFTSYSHLRACDPELHDALNHIVRTCRRSVSAVESANVLPAGTVFYSHPLSNRGAVGREQRGARRNAWNLGALEALAEAEIVFMDPDNGFPGRSAHVAASNGSKHVFPNELEPYLRRGQSLIVYHHQTRERGGLAVTLPEKFEMLQSLGFGRAWAFVFRRVSVRVYFVLPAHAHTSVLSERSDKFLESAWGKYGHFQLVGDGRAGDRDS